MAVRSVCVFCGSRAGANPRYEAEATALGRWIAGEGWRLVYGAGDVGLMGAVARAAQAAGGETFGVIPEHLVRWEVGKTDLTRYVVTETMHERKGLMHEHSQAFVALPGGLGTFEEILEALTWAVLKYHSKPVALLDVGGYWESFIASLDHAVDEGFFRRDHRELLIVEEDPERLYQRLSDWEDPDLPIVK